MKSSWKSSAKCFETHQKRVNTIKTLCSPYSRLGAHRQNAVSVHKALIPIKTLCCRTHASAPAPAPKGRPAAEDALLFNYPASRSRAARALNGLAELQPRWCLRSLGAPSKRRPQCKHCRRTHASYAASAVELKRSSAAPRRPDTATPACGFGGSGPGSSSSSSSAWPPPCRCAASSLWRTHLRSHDGTWFVANVARDESRPHK
mmetsp:Transcript_6423/g.20579  ORF Transcript_6423/g.20579 Transcript_6423/m.20579 type:complete len:204 (-) Transcript_6423:213-824(-)